MTCFPTSLAFGWSDETVLPVGPLFSYICKGNNVPLLRLMIKTPWHAPSCSLWHWASCRCSVMSKFLQPHGLQHARLPCLSPSPRACSNSCPLSQWCHPIISFLCCSLILLPSIIPSISVLLNELTLRIRWPKYWSFNIIPSSEY